MSDINVEVTARGAVSEQARAQAREKIGALGRYVKGPIQGARVVLIRERNPRIADPARVEAELDVKGRMIRAHAQAPTVEAAVDEVVERLQRQLRGFVDRLVTKHREHDRTPRESHV